MKKNTFEDYGIIIKPIENEDLEILLNWRNSSLIRSQMANQAIISKKTHLKWFQDLQKKNNELHFLVWLKGIRTGYINFKGNGNLFEQKFVNLGGYVVDSKVNNGLLGISISMIQLDIVFGYLKVPEARISVRKTNTRAIKFNKEMGYIKFSDNDDYYFYYNTPKTFGLSKERFSKYFRRSKK